MTFQFTNLSLYRTSLSSRKTGIWRDWVTGWWFKRLWWLFHKADLLAWNKQEPWNPKEGLRHKFWHRTVTLHVQAITWARVSCHVFIWNNGKLLGGLPVIHLPEWQDDSSGKAPNKEVGMCFCLRFNHTPMAATVRKDKACNNYTAKTQCSNGSRT